MHLCNSYKHIAICVVLCKKNVKLIHAFHRTQSINI